MSTGHIVDIIVVCFVILMAFFGMKRGFIREVVSLFGVAIALAGAYFCSGYVANFVYNAFADKVAYNTVYSAIDEAADKTVDGLKTAIPEYIIEASEHYNYDIDEKLSEVDKATEAKKEEISQNICDSVAKPIIVSTTKLIVFIILFIMFKWLLQLLAKGLDLLARFPLIRTANEGLGFVVGLLRGMLFSAAAALLIIGYILMTGNDIFGIDGAAVEGSYVLSFMRLGVFDKYISI